MATPILTKMVGLCTSYQIWNKVHTYYATQSRAKIKKLKVQLRNPKKDRSISTYLLDQKKIVDTLAVVVLQSRSMIKSKLFWMAYLTNMTVSLLLSPLASIHTRLKTLKIFCLLKRNVLTNIACWILVLFKHIFRLLLGNR